MKFRLFFLPGEEFFMIVKQQPDDFFVEELTQVVPGQGPFALYRLEKRGWTTPDALQAIRRRWKVDQRRMSFGGLKDRHAHTVQYVTIFRGPQRKLTHEGITVAYLGQVEEPFTSQHIQANRFRLVIRALAAKDIGQARQALAEVKACGVPNYFDDQRFGSVAGHGNFLAKALILGQYEKALRLALTAPYAHDRSAQKKEKALLRSHWGDWPRCQQLLGHGHARVLVNYLLHHPDDFAGAVVRLHPELRGLYLSAYQSHLWNRMLGLWLQAHLSPDQLVPVSLRLGEYPMHRHFNSEKKATLAELRLPLHSPRVTWEENDPRRQVFEQVLAEEKLLLEQFKLKGLKDLFFSKGDRAALCLPTHLEGAAAADESHPGQQKLTLSFELPRGAYATLIVKRLTL
jgi:tRNA pseudouridine13 synthase